MGVKRVRRQNNDGTKIVRPAARGPEIHSLTPRAPSPATGPQIRAFFRNAPGEAEKKTKKLRKSSCGFSAIRIDHGHRRGGHLTRFRERAISSVGRAPRLHRGCREFESLIAHHFPDLKLLKCSRGMAFVCTFRHAFGHKTGAENAGKGRCGRSKSSVSTRPVPRRDPPPEAPTRPRDHLASSATLSRPDDRPLRRRVRE